MKNNFKKIAQIFIGFSFFILSPVKSNAQIRVDVNLDVKHSVDGVSEFDRKKWINLHSAQTENDFKGELPLMNHIINDLGVSLGREVGAQRFNFDRTNEDPARPGFADISHIEALGAQARNNYAKNQQNLHQYEGINDLNISTHDTFFPDGDPTGRGWVPKDNSAVAEWLAHYIKNFFGTGGSTGFPTPKFFSIINEPEFLNKPMNDIFDYHVAVADKVRELNPDILIGGFTSASSRHEAKANRDDPETVANPGFDNWNKNWKAFIDIAGAKMDYYDVHWYDEPFDGFQFLKEGANLEASFDIIESYSHIKLGEVKPFVVSEYGSFIADYSNQFYTAGRDWRNIKAFSSMLLNFMDRPNQILKSVPFMIIKAEWGFTGDKPYAYRLLRRTNETNNPSQFSGEYVFTEFVKFFELWSDVKGTRIDTHQTDLDIQVDGFVNENKAYVIVNNLYFTTKSIDLALIGNNGNTVESIKVKHLYLNGDSPELAITEPAATSTSVTIAPEATMIIEYTFTDTVLIDNTSDETKYYADTYLQPIVANQARQFTISGVTKGAIGEAVLRVSLGRDHGLSLRPIVTFNGSTLTVPDNYRGYDMRTRKRWFGTLEIPVPNELLQATNSISVTLPDNGGHVSSMAMQVYKFSRQTPRDGTTLSIPENEITTQEVIVWPNPTEDLLTVVFPSNFNNATYSINTINGAALLTGKIEASDSTLSLKSLASGIYFLTIKSTNGRSIIKKITKI